MLRIATWNVNSVKARLDHVLAWLEENQPDFLFLQEIKCTTEKFPALEFEAIGYHASVKGQPAYNGVATLSRHKVEIIADTLPGNEADTHARFMDVAYKDWRLINIYAPNGNPIGTEKFTYKMEWMDRLQLYLNKLLKARQKFVIGGDFNVIPENLDAKHPENWRNDALFQKETQAKWRSLCHLGLHDAYRSLHPKGQDYSFWDYMAGSWHRDNGIRIDHFLVSPNAADKLESCVIDKGPRGWERPSDHTPVIVTFNI
ncbi:MAG: xth [Alphaproteobacteria bacterium]|nr:xth [Alphaproteobacteria bacterium]